MCVILTDIHTQTVGEAGIHWQYVVELHQDTNTFFILLIVWVFVGVQTYS